MEVSVNILNRVISLEAYFLAGYKEATGLRKELEGNSTPSAPPKGLSEEEIAKKVSKRMKGIITKNK